MYDLSEYSGIDHFPIRTDASNYNTSKKSKFSKILAKITWVTKIENETKVLKFDWILSKIMKGQTTILPENLGRLGIALSFGNKLKSL